MAISEFSKLLHLMVNAIKWICNLHNTTFTSSLFVCARVRAYVCVAKNVFQKLWIYMKICALHGNIMFGIMLNDILHTNLIWCRFVCAAFALQPQMFCVVLNLQWLDFSDCELIRVNHHGIWVNKNIIFSQKNEHFFIIFITIFFIWNYVKLCV